MIESAHSEGRRSMGKSFKLNSVPSNPVPQLLMSSTSLQNFLYFPPFAALPAADELDPSFYSENAQGAFLEYISELDFQLARPRNAVKSSMGMHDPGRMMTGTPQPSFTGCRHAPPIQNMVLCRRDCQRCFVAGSGLGPQVTHSGRSRGSAWGTGQA